MDRIQQMIDGLGPPEGSARTTARSGPPVDISFDETRNCYHGSIDWGSFQGVGDVVTRTIATLLSTDPADLQPLYEVIDPEALDDLFTPVDDDLSRGEGHVAFPYEGFEVRLSAGGELELRPIEGASP